jgi:pilus assembly protein CpaB
VSQVVIQDVRVLGVDLNADPASNKPATPNTATLEVSVPDAQKLSVAGDLGKLSLALRRTGSTEVAQTSPMNGASFVSGGGPIRPIHASIRRVSTPAAPMGPPLIMIVEGDGHGDGHKSAHKDHAPKPPAAPAAPTSLTPDSAKASTMSVASSGQPS